MSGTGGGSALVFLDTETTGLSLDDDIWEFAAIRREVDGTESETHVFLQHSTTMCARLPESFRLDHEQRFPNSHTAKWHPDTLSQGDAAKVIAGVFYDKPHVVGAVPNFDTERLRRLLDDYDLKDARWHYHLIDVENLVVGYLAAKGIPVGPPWDSDDLAAAVGVRIAKADRHTAMGDARWARDIYDAVMRGER